MDETAHKQMVFEANRKSMGIAYLLWLFLGFFGVHRFYAGSTKTGVMQLVLALSVVGWLVLIPWLLADLVLIPGMIRDENMKTINMLTHGSSEAPIAAAPKAVTEADRRRDAMLEDLRTTGYRKKPRDTSHLYR
ncbi:TM2 domain-containing protein [Erythrobacter crassostreae]|uniref:TM2 domain-containing protein n=1 Tax=Erythrobacter crassostreae TaxID=2828328 RepID=A0A9X1F4V5_9SPHN|nr:TM2 domain-containing protein [Erythrobacter crassostrea]MBV7259368.1 TM2 domain-containing protein [Erythrobacter crassostrea]